MVRMNPYDKDTTIALLKKKSAVVENKMWLRHSEVMRFRFPCW